MFFFVSLQIHDEVVLLFSLSVSSTFSSLRDAIVREQLQRLSKSLTKYNGPLNEIIFLRQPPSYLWRGLHLFFFSRAIPSGLWVSCDGVKDPPLIRWNGALRDLFFRCWKMATNLRWPRTVVHGDKLHYFKWLRLFWPGRLPLTWKLRDAYLRPSRSLFVILYTFFRTHMRTPLLMGKQKQTLKFFIFRNNNLQTRTSSLHYTLYMYIHVKRLTH